MSKQSRRRFLYIGSDPQRALQWIKNQFRQTILDDAVPCLPYVVDVIVVSDDDVQRGSRVLDTFSQLISYLTVYQERYKRVFMTISRKDSLVFSVRTPPEALIFFAQLYMEARKRMTDENILDSRANLPFYEDYKG